MASAVPKLNAVIFFICASFTYAWCCQKVWCMEKREAVCICVCASTCVCVKQRTEKARYHQEKVRQFIACASPPLNSFIYAAAVPDKIVWHGSKCTHVLWTKAKKKKRKRRPNCTIIGTCSWACISSIFYQWETYICIHIPHAYFTHMFTIHQVTGECLGAQALPHMLLNVQKIKSSCGFPPSFPLLLPYISLG